MQGKLTYSWLMVVYHCRRIPSHSPPQITFPPHTTGITHHPRHFFCTHTTPQHLFLQSHKTVSRPPPGPSTAVREHYTTCHHVEFADSGARLAPARCWTRLYIADTLVGLRS